MITCPIFKNKQDFKNIENVVGSTRAYNIWDKNNGNDILTAPNGEPSILFSNLLDKYDGDTNAAIKAKSIIYSVDYLDRYGNWLKGELNFSGKLDLNGEPLVDYVYVPDIRTYSNDNSIFGNYTLSNTFGDEIVSKLNESLQVSSSELFSSMNARKLTSNKNIILTSVLAKHDVPVVLQSLPGGVLMRTFQDENGGSYIAIDKSIAESVSSDYLSLALSHEVIHALTADALKSPRNTIDMRLKTATESLYNTFDKIFPATQYSRINYNDGYYILNSIEDFAAVFATDDNARRLLYQKAEELDNKTVKGRLKQFVNKLSKFLLNKEFFKKNKEKLSEYENLLTGYLESKKSVRYGNITDEKLFNFLYNSLSNKTLSEDYRAELAKRLEEYSKFLKSMDIKIHEPIEMPVYTKEDFENFTIDRLRDYVALSLTSRVAYIRNSNLPMDEKVKKTTELNQEIARFESKNNSLFRVFSDFVLNSLGFITKDVDYIASFQNEDGSWNAMRPDEYMTLTHSNIGVYHKIFSAMSAAMNNRAILNRLEKDLAKIKIEPTDIIKDIDSLKSLVLDGFQVTEEGSGYLSSVLARSVTKTVLDKANEVHDLSVAEYINDISNSTADFDTSSVFTSFFSTDAAKDPILRVLNRTITESLHKADRETYNTAVELVKLVEKLKSKSDINLLYEKDEKGNATQYLVRRLNYGKMLEEYKEKLEELNRKFGLPYGNRIPPSKQEDFVKYNEELEEWKSKNVERPFLPEYYKAHSKLSAFTKKLRDDLMIEISAIESKAINSEKYGDDYYHYEELSRSELNRLNELQMYLKLLKSDRDIHGNLKEAGTDSYTVAKELQSLDEELYKDRTPEYDVEAWQALRNKIIEECGGKEAMESGDKKAFNWKRFNRWERLNTVKELKRDDSGEILLFKHIDNEIDYDYAITYEVDGDGGAKYESLRKQKSEITSLYRDKISGDVDAEQMPAEIKKKILLIDREMNKIKKKAKNKNRGLKNAAKQRRELIKKYAKFENSALYQELLEYHRSLGEDDFIIFLRNTGYGSLEDVENPWRPYSYFTKLVVKPEYESLFVNVRPGKGFIKKDGKGSYRNPNYDDSFGEYMVPKNISKYKNEDFDKITSNEPLSDLYEKIESLLELMRQIYGIQRGSLYQLPGITGGLFTYIRGKGDKLTKALLYLSDTTGISSELFLTQGAEFGEDINSLLESMTESDETLSDKSRTVGSMPDGRELRIIPRHYMSKLDKPHAISRDIVGIMCEAIKQANRFKHKSQIKDVCEMLYDYIGERKIRKPSGIDKNGIQKYRDVEGKQSNTYKTARNYLDMNLYGVRLQRANIAGVEITKQVSDFRKFSTLLNLGWKPSIAFVGALTSQAASFVQSVVGTKYNKGQYMAAGFEVLTQLMKSLITGNGIAESDTTNKMEALAELFDIANAAERKYKLTNTNRLVKGVRLNQGYSFMTFCDFYTKSHIMIATLMSLKYFEGQFLNKEDLRNSADYYKMSDKEFKEVEREFDKCPSLYSILQINDGILQLSDEKYKEAFEKLFTTIKARIVKLAEQADGMPSEQQKAAFTATIWGQFIIMHRQFLPLMLQNRFAEMTYDQDTQLWQNGIFRTAANVYSLMFKGIMPLHYDPTKKLKFGFGIPVKEKELTSYKVMSYVTAFGCASGLALAAPWIGIPGGFVVGGVAGLMASIMKGESLNKLFNDYSSQLNAQKSRARLKHLKQICTEVFFYKLIVLSLSPLLALLFTAFGGDEDDDESWATRLYWHAQYVINKFAWEFYNPYRADDIMNNIRSLTAATSGLDAAEAVGKWAASGFDTAKNSMFSRGTLFDTVSSYTNLFNIDDDYSGDLSDDELVDRGAYKYGIPFLMDGAFTKRLKKIFKTLPIKNLYEEMYGSKEKNNYFKHQIMKESE